MISGLGSLEVLDRLGLLGLAYSIYMRAQILNPTFSIVYVRTKMEGAPDGLPLPPLSLIRLVLRVPDFRSFIEGGRKMAEDIEEIMAKNRWDIQGKKVLDFGCGLGRVLRHLRGKAELYGTDYNRKLISWCKKNLNFATFDTNLLQPPTRYPSEQFDFIYAISVFTHLPECFQFGWIEELWRILREGGHLLITIHGESCIGKLSRDELRRFKAGQLVVHWPRYAGTNLCAAYHPEQYVRHVFSNRFRILEFIPKGVRSGSQQDIFLMQKINDLKRFS